MTKLKDRTAFFLEHMPMTEAQIRENNPSRPRIYDIGIDGFRFATQKDLDDFQIIKQAFYKIVDFAKREHESVRNGTYPGTGQK